MVGGDCRSPPPARVRDRSADRSKSGGVDLLSVSQVVSCLLLAPHGEQPRGRCMSRSRVGERRADTLSPLSAGFDLNMVLLAPRVPLDDSAIGTSCGAMSAFAECPFGHDMATPSPFQGRDSLLRALVKSSPPISGSPPSFPPRFLPWRVPGRAGWAGLLPQALCSCLPPSSTLMPSGTVPPVRRVTWWVSCCVGLVLSRTWQGAHL